MSNEYIEKVTTYLHLRVVRIFHTHSMRPNLTHSCWALPTCFKEINLDNGIELPMGKIMKEGALNIFNTSHAYLQGEKVKGYLGRT